VYFIRRFRRIFSMAFGARLLLVILPYFYHSSFILTAGVARSVWFVVSLPLTVDDVFRPAWT
jgi:hypothetical protein